MKPIEESVVIAMDGTDKELFPYIPYILQDLWEIGSDPEIIINLIKEHFADYTKLKVLDFGCGKGSVLVNVAKTLGCKCYGIDAVPEFIEYAQHKAVEFNVDHLCTFEKGDIRQIAGELTDYDVVILGSIGPVLGDYYATLTTLSNCIKRDGVFIIDDAYIEDSSNFNHPLILKHNVIMQQINAAGMQLIKNVIIQQDAIKDSDEHIFDQLTKRCNELIDKHPAKRDLFLEYIKKQKEENDVLENKVICTTMMIKHKDL